MKLGLGSESIQIRIDLDPYPVPNENADLDPIAMKKMTKLLLEVIKSSSSKTFQEYACTNLGKFEKLWYYLLRKTITCKDRKERK